METVTEKMWEQVQVCPPLLLWKNTTRFLTSVCDTVGRGWQRRWLSEEEHRICILKICTAAGLIYPHGFLLDVFVEWVTCDKTVGAKKLQDLTTRSILILTTVDLARNQDEWQREIRIKHAPSEGEGRGGMCDQLSAGLVPSLSLSILFSPFISASLSLCLKPQ